MGTCSWDLWSLKPSLLPKPEDQMNQGLTYGLPWRNYIEWRSSTHLELPCPWHQIYQALSCAPKNLYVRIAFIAAFCSSSHFFKLKTLLLPALVVLVLEFISDDSLSYVVWSFVAVLNNLELSWSSETKRIMAGTHVISISVLILILVPSKSRYQCAAIFGFIIY